MKNQNRKNDIAKARKAEFICYCLGAIAISVFMSYLA